MGIIYLITRHAANLVSISRLTGVSNENAPPRADAPIPDAMMFFAALTPA